MADYGYRYKAVPDSQETPEWSPDGFGNQLIGQEYYGQNAYDRDVDRYRARGEAAQGRGAPTLDQTQASQSRGLQLSALELMRRQAAGQAASSSEILSQRANENAARGAASQVTAARGPGAAVAAFNGANTAATDRSMAINAQNANQRAGEISRAQGGFATGAGAVRGQDLSAATTNAQLAEQQRRLNEQKQQTEERLAYDTRRFQEGATQESLGQAYAERDRLRANAAAKTANDIQKVKDTVSTAASMGSSAASASDASAQQQKKPDTASDARAKMRVGSLASLMRGR